MRKVGCFGLVLGLAAVVALFLVVQGWGGAGPAPRTLTVQIGEGSTLAGAATELEKAGAIPSARRFRLYARVFGSGDPIKAGEYRIAPHTSQSDILKLMQAGKVVQRLVVVPDSYAFERGDTRASVVAQMQSAMKAYLAKAWAARKPGIAVTTPEQAIILASIVEKETGKPSERRTVAAVYGNRLRNGMPLQADPTVIYPITKGRPLGRRILRSELQAKNGYNTYAEAGLPVGPIANPGRASIDAVLDPAQTQALYFVADGTGGHVFANTLAEHNANVKKWYAIRKARGEM
jgi:UPF0755 protein